MSEERDEKEFKVTDRRRHRATDDAPKPPDETPAETATGDADKGGPAETKHVDAEADAAHDHEHGHDHAHDHGPVEVTFIGLIFSLATQAMMAMGDLADPDGRSMKDLTLAKQTIDLLGMLREKTKGNLTAEEDGMLSHTLRDLRLRYVQAKG